ncbi:aminodeoxychorismate lyase [Ornithinimicrobium humiphilum]|uniref:Branched-chain amino acid aminotransferase n=1 Tax=Ornithinimicrobium humiphilum TaxID=125288 RepID=A0A543KNL8_9MICO|nr:aminotransferase class IV [Ornithinimicrobium humiphilum]TQM96679.1 branched-chain amino acid aminotransferase [Ornithinimicrobium humiphilum]
MADGSAQVRVWVDGRIVGDEPAFSALDHGITVGDGVFETGKVVDGVLFAASRHHARMERSLAGLGLPALDRERLQEGIDAVLALGPLPFGRLRYTVTAGPGPLGSDRTPGRATYLVTASEVPHPPTETSVAVVPWARNEVGALAGLKTTSYADNVVALAAAKRAGAAEALLPNTTGALCEGTGSNVFVVVDGVVLTPSLASGPLAGVTRELTIEWLRDEGVDVVEDVLPMTILDDADEVWITSSVRDVCAVTRIEVSGPATLGTGVTLPAPTVTPRVVGDGPGPMARFAQDVFARRSAADMDP